MCKTYRFATIIHFAGRVRAQVRAEEDDRGREGGVQYHEGMVAWSSQVKGGVCSLHPFFGGGKTGIFGALLSVI